MRALLFFPLVFLFGAAPPAAAPASIPATSAPAPSSAKQKRTVTKASVVLVQEASFLSAPAKNGKAILRGEQVEVDGPPKKGWYAAKHLKSSGFLHASYLADRPVAFKVSVTEVEGKSALSGSYSLAVGGFSAETESVYREKSTTPKKGFAVVDARLPKDFTGTPPQPDVTGLKAFIETGKLKEPAP